MNALFRFTYWHLGHGFFPAISFGDFAFFSMRVFGGVGSERMAPWL